MRTVAAFVLAAAFVLTGCSGLSEVFNAPTGPNALFKTVGSEMAHNAVLFRGVVIGACVELTVVTDSGPAITAGGLLPVSVSGEIDHRDLAPPHAEMLFLAEHEELGERPPEEFSMRPMPHAWR